MKVDKIYQNYDQNKNVKLRKKSSNVTFTRKPIDLGEKIAENLANRKVLDFMREKLA